MLHHSRVQNWSTDECCRKLTQTSPIVNRSSYECNRTASCVDTIRHDDRQLCTKNERRKLHGGASDSIASLFPPLLALLLAATGLLVSVALLSLFPFPCLLHDFHGMLDRRIIGDCSAGTQPLRCFRPGCAPRCCRWRLPSRIVQPCSSVTARSAA